ncbi:programmed cell death 1 ligand 1-like, partial [Clarias magur]
GILSLTEAMWRRLPRTARGDEHELNPLLGSGRKLKYPEQTHPAQGECANSPHTEPGRNSNPRPWRGEASHPKVTHSADLKEECRFVLLGGDDFVKYNACNFILRTGQVRQGADLDDWQVKKNLVLGRHVTVAAEEITWSQLKCTCSESLHRLSHNDIYSDDLPSDETSSDLRLVLLGGDCMYNNHAAGLILRSHDINLANNPKKGHCRGVTINGRQVSIFVAPSYWMSHLASYMFFRNGVESIRHEIQNCTTVTFPGPHAFLLVMRAGHATGKEHHLLKALTYLFGAEALQYTIVLFVHGHEWENPTDALKNRCVKMCGKKYFNLENSDESVEELFGSIEAMSQRKETRMFVQHSYEKVMKMSYESWESNRLCNENKLRKELADQKTELETLRQTERELFKEQEASKHREIVLQKDLDTAKSKETDLLEELQASRQRESQLCNDLDAVRSAERQLRKQLNDLQVYEAGQLKPVKRNSGNTRDRPNTLIIVHPEQDSYDGELHDKITMGCQFTAVRDVSRISITWERVKPQPTVNVYHLHQGSESPDFTDEQFQRRVRLLKEELENSRAVIELSQLRLNDSGTYRCVVIQDDGDYKQTTLTVRATYKAIKKTVRTLSDKEVELTCESRGLPLARVTWSDGKLMEPDLKNRSETSSVENSDGVFVVTSRLSVTQDVNNYTCSYWTDGSKTATFNIPDEIPEKRKSTSGYVGIAVIVVMCMFSGFAFFLLRRRKKGKASRNTTTEECESPGQNLTVTSTD